MHIAITLPSPLSGHELVALHGDLCPSGEQWKPDASEALYKARLIYRLTTRCLDADPYAADSATLEDQLRAMYTRVTPCRINEAVGIAGLYFDPIEQYKAIHITSWQPGLLPQASPRASRRFIAGLADQYDGLLCSI